MKKDYSRDRPACLIDLDNIEETIEDRIEKFKKDLPMF